MNDTSPFIAQKVREMIQEKSPVERMEMGCSMYETSKELVTNSILNEFPSLSKSELRQEIFLKFYGSDFDVHEKEKILKHLASR